MEMNEEQKKAIEKFKALPKGQSGRPPKEFGPLLKIAAAVLKDSGMTLKDIAAELGTKPETVKKALFNKAIQIKVEDLEKVRQGFAQHIAEIITKMLLAANSDEYITRLMQVKNPGLIIGLATLIDKLNVITGKPTAILETRDMVESVQKQLKELEELEAAIKQSMIKTENPKEN